MIARLPSQPVWPDKPRRVFFLYNLNLTLVVVGVLVLAVAIFVVSKGASAIGGSQPLVIPQVVQVASADQPIITPLIEQSRVAVQPGSAIIKPGPTLSYVQSSTSRLEQLIGDKDVVTKLPTTNQTNSRYGIEGTDLGYSFEHNGKLYFLFGDTIGPTGGDVMAVSSSTDPNGPLRFDIVTDAAGNYVPIQPPTIEMAGYETPVSGISLNGQMYVVVKTSYFPPNQDTVAGVLTRYDPVNQTFKVMRWISSLPGGHFITPTLRLVNGSITGLGAGPWVLMFGSGDYRNSNAFLAATPAASFEKGDGTRYFAGMSKAGNPTWSDKEGDAKAIIGTPDVGDISVSYVEKLGVWVALFDSLQPRGILASYSPQPWGPWSQPQVLYEPSRDPGYGLFIHDPSRSTDDGLAGPFNDPDNSAQKSYGGFYAPYIIERFTQVNGDQLTLHYVMSTWNPYYVVHMKSTLKITQPPEPPPYKARDAYPPISEAIADVAR